MQAQDTSRTGLFLPAEGTVNVLYIFSQFKDDNYCPVECAEWPPGRAPLFMDRIIDRQWSASLTPGSATDYFAQMSFNRLKFIGKAVYMTAPHSRQWYIDNNKRRNDIHREIIAKLDSTMDFAPYDNWKHSKKNKHINISDGKIDMICFIWRNIDKDMPAAATLNFGNYGDLGGGSALAVDNAQRQISMSSWGSGSTIIACRYYDALKISSHEFAHYLLGNNSEHIGFASWGMLDDWGMRSKMITFFERDRLSWNPDTSHIYEIDTLSGTVSITIRDFLSTGDAVRIATKNKNEYFIIENHQLLSQWDIPDLSARTKGLYVFHQHGKRGRDVTFLPADGRYQWPLLYMTKNIWGNNPTPMLPVRYKGQADPLNGYTDCEKLPYIYNNKNYNVQLNFIKNMETGEIENIPLYKGDGKDAFAKDYKEVFSPWSNTNSQLYDKTPSGIAFEIISYEPRSGAYTLKVYVNTALQGKPAKPMNPRISMENSYPLLQWDANLEPDLAYYEIHKQKRAGGKPLIITVNKRENYYRDSTVSPDQGGLWAYKICAVDSSAKISIMSESIYLKE